MLIGRMPTAGQARTLDAVFTAYVDHSVTPAAMIGRAFASYGTSTPAAILLDFEMPSGCAAAFVMLTHSLSNLAHHLEERTQHTRWRHVHQEYVNYTGPTPSWAQALSHASLGPHCIGLAIVNAQECNTVRASVVDHDLSNEN